MRGVAALTAGLAVWVLLGGKLPKVRQPSLRLPNRRDITTAAASGLAGGLLALGLSGIGVVSVVVGLLLAVAWLAGRHIAVEREGRLLAEAWPDFLAMTRSRLAAGRPVPEAAVEAALHQGEIMAPFGRRLERSLQQGVSFRAALEAERSRIGDPIADRVITSLVFAAQAGGGRVADILGLLGQSVGDELRLRRAHDAALTQQRLTAAVALAAPWGLLLLTVATNPQAAAAYGTSEGARVVLIGLALTLSGFWAARRSARLSKPSRILG